MYDVSPSVRKEQPCRFPNMIVMNMKRVYATAAKACLINSLMTYPAIILTQKPTTRAVMASSWTKTRMTTEVVGGKSVCTPILRYKAAKDGAPGDTLTYAGIWPSGYLKGKTRWRFVSTNYDNGHFANEDGPVNGFMVDTTSNILCPNGIGGTGKH